MKKIILSVFLSIIFLPTAQTNAQAFPPPLTLISPNGGEVFKPGQSVEVVFKSNLPLGTEISFALNREDGWYKEIGERYRINKLSDLYTKKITIPSDTPLNKYMIVIEDSNRKYSDLSDSNFEIKSNVKSSIKLNSQKQNQKYLRESSILLSWKTENIKAVDIYLVKGNEKYLFLENYSGGNEFSYAVGRVDNKWGIDELKNGSYSIAICQTGNPIDKQCAKFKFKIYGKNTEISISPSLKGSSPIVKVLSPNKGKTYRIGDKLKIKWQADNIPKNTGIFFQLQGEIKGVDNGFGIDLPSMGFSFDSQDFSNMIDAEKGKGNFSWAIPDIYNFPGYDKNVYRVQAILRGENIAPNQNNNWEEVNGFSEEFYIKKPKKYLMII